MSKNKVVVIAGPTAVGKSEIGIELALHFGGEIISGDSMQIYRGLDIGTAKVTLAERKRVPHHLIDERDPAESYSAAAFQKEAKERIKNMNDDGKLPFVVGGTGFYIRALTRDLDLHETSADEGFREEMEQYAQTHGTQALHEKLQAIDYQSASRIHPNNLKKVIRALEINHTTGRKQREFSEQETQPSPYDLALIGLTMERDVLYRRINERVDQMVADGVMEEARWLFEYAPEDSQAAQAIGYKEFYSYFKGEYSIEQAVEQLKRNSRRYAKRQLTWFRNKEKMKWFDMTSMNKEEKIQEMIEYIEGKFS
ncbi:tRNA (adenosine(37)-N6)-dimethylallyltransferase MiaA [Bacillus piscicola]|uniref:tRNA (adenosine(37)-N6)-dimethylallyltransferase MiaA n=1 Tax=Bacillus piscicola TaxID=1632684 RepID=UPI001F0951C7|nr:tRNA (adenosine(37)-N6)-dimethylallyltransferase MiaA [Bacillus piscicola]